MMTTFEDRQFEDAEIFIPIFYFFTWKFGKETHDDVIWGPTTEEGIWGRRNFYFNFIYFFTRTFLFQFYSQVIVFSLNFNTITMLPKFLKNLFPHSINIISQKSYFHSSLKAVSSRVLVISMQIMIVYYLKFINFFYNKQRRWN